MKFRLDVIQKIYNMYPDAIKGTSTINEPPLLHRAVAVNGISEEVILFLAEKDPSALEHIVANSSRRSTSRLER